MINFLKKIKLFKLSEIQNYLFIFIFFISLILSLLIFLKLSGYLSDQQNVEQISLLLSINFSLIIVLIFISLDKIRKIFFF